MALKNIVGKAVVLTANDEVGFGSEGNSILGVVTKIEKAGDTSVYPISFNGVREGATFKLNSATRAILDNTVTDDYVVTVEFGKMFENIPISATSTKKPVAGDVVVADGAGGLVKYVEAAVASEKVPVKALTAYATSVDTTANVATIRIL